MYPYSDQNKKKVCYENLLLIDTYRSEKREVDCCKISRIAWAIAAIVHCLFWIFQAVCWQPLQLVLWAHTHFDKRENYKSGEDEFCLEWPWAPNCWRSEETPLWSAKGWDKWENNLLDIFHCKSGSVNDNQGAGCSRVSCPLALFNASYSCAAFLMPALAFGDECHLIWWQ